MRPTHLRRMGFIHNFNSPYYYYGFKSNHFSLEERFWGMRPAVAETASEHPVVGLVV